MSADRAPDKSPWLNARRLRAQGLALAVCLWGIYVWVLATPGLRDRNHLIKGTDFIHFYTLGSLALEHRGEALYDMRAQTELLSRRVPEAAGTRYLPLYGPQVSLVFAPLATLPYAYALASWWFISADLYFLCVFLVWSVCPALRKRTGMVFLLALAYPAFWHLISWGQTSAMALACFTAAYLLLLRGRDFAAGLALGCLAFKPQLAIAAAVIFVLCRAGRILLGALLSAAVQLLAGWVYYGTTAMREYVAHLLQIPHVTALLEPRLYQTHCLRTFWQMLIPWPMAAIPIYVISAVIVFAITFRCWRSSLPLSLRYSALLLASALVSPHLTVYDLVILAPALLLLADWLLANLNASDQLQIAILSYLIYVLPLIGFTARWTHVQLSVIAMAALLWILGRMPKRRIA